MMHPLNRFGKCLDWLFACQLFACLIVACWFACAIRPANAVPPDSTDESLRVMCQRGLAGSAAEYCRIHKELYIEQDGLRSRWAMRQMECQAQAALQTSGDSAEAWQAVAKIESEYRQKFSQDPRLPWLSWQLARTDLLRSQQALARWLSTPAATQHREQALLSVRAIQKQIDAVEADIKERLPLAVPKSTPANSPNSQAPSRDLQELAIDCTLLRCEALLVRARCYALGTPDRLAALADVDRTAGEVLQRAQPDWSSQDELMVAQATAGLEVGRRNASLNVLLSILRGKIPTDVNQATASPAPPNTSPTASQTVSQTVSPRTRLRAGEVIIEALCQANELAPTSTILQLMAAQYDGPEVNLSRMRVELVRLQAMPSNEREAALRSIVQQAEEMGKRYGNYWRNRSEALLVAYAASSSSRATTAPPTNDLAGNNNSTGNTKLDPKRPEDKPNTPPDRPQVPEPKTNVQQDLIAIEVRQLLAGGQITAAVTKLKTAIAAPRLLPKSCCQRAWCWRVICSSRASPRVSNGSGTTASKRERVARGHGSTGTPVVEIRRSTTSCGGTHHGDLVLCSVVAE